MTEYPADFKDSIVEKLNEYKTDKPRERKQEQKEKSL